MVETARRLTTIDGHAGGGPLRLIVGGYPPLEGSTLEQRRQHAEQIADPIRLSLLREPRGHADMVAAVLTEPGTPEAVAGLLFLTREGFRVFSGHGLIAAVTIALERALIVPPSTDRFIVETLAGVVDVRPAPRADRAARVLEVSYRPPPVMVTHAAVPVTVDGRRVAIDVVWAAGWCGIADREALAIGADEGGLETVRRGALRFLHAFEEHVRRWPAPVEGRASLAGVVLTGPASRPDADLRSITVSSDGVIDRSPSGTGTAAVLAVLDAMGVASEDRALVHEGPSGLVFRARVADRLQWGERAAIVPEITGQAWITGEHTFLLAEGDPLATGFVP
jgi:trans-L-3-hydroxyproline dehydratase